MLVASSTGFPEPSPQIQAPAAGLVEVDVQVIDADGNPATDLRIEELELLEDGQVQDIVSFRVVNIPVDTLPGTYVETDVRTNEAAGEIRLFVLVLDDLHITAARSERVRQLARQFVEQRVGPQDLVAVVPTGGGGAFLPLTNERASLLESIGRFRGNKRALLPLPQIEPDPRMQRTRRNQNRDSEELFEDRAEETNRSSMDLDHTQLALQTLQTLQAICQALKNVQVRRKAIIFFSEGVDYGRQGRDESSETFTYIAEARRTVAEAGNAHLAIYSLDPFGPDSQRQELDSRLRASGNPGAARSGQQRRQDSLRWLSNETGGIALLDPSQFEDGLRRIVEESSHYYLLGYYPTNGSQDGKGRNIQVRVKRSGTRVRAPAQVLSPPPVGDDRDESVMPLVNEATPLPRIGIPLRVVAVSRDLSASKARVSLVVDMDVAGFVFAPVADTLHDQVEIEVTVFDRRGKVVNGQKQTLTLDLKPRTHRSMLRHGFRAVSDIELPPGAYRLQVVAQENGGDRRGAVHYDLEVPECGRKGIVMGGVFLGSLKETIVPVAVAPEMKRRLNFPPTTLREFSPDDQILLQTEVCDTSASLVDLNTTLVGEDGAKVIDFSTQYEVGAEDDGMQIVHHKRIPLRKIPQGSYLLELTARNPETNEEVTRTLRFAIASSR